MSSDLTVAVLSDVHGNAFAAQAIIDEIREFQPDLIVNLGDQIWGQADPLRALDSQRALQAIEVRGNNDERLTMPEPELGTAYLAFQQWLTQHVPATELHRLATLPLCVDVADGTILAAHGTPISSWDSLLLGWDGAAYVRRPEAEIRQRLFASATAEVVLVGHMHRENVRRVDGRLLVSVGAVSSQTDGDPRARWGLLTRRAGRWHVEFRRVVYDWDAAAAWDRRHRLGLGDDTDWYARPVNVPIRDASVMAPPAAATTS